MLLRLSVPDIPFADMGTALAAAEAALEEGVRYCRDVLGVGEEDAVAGQTRG